MNFPIRKITIITASILVLAYLFSNFWLYKKHTHLTFPVIKEDPYYFFSDKLVGLQLTYEKIELTGTYGNTSACILPSDSDKNIWIIHLHGTNNLYYSDSNLWRYKIWNNLGINILTLNYITQEGSKQILSSEKMYQSALMAYNYLVTKSSVPYDHILVYGEGLGTYPASKLAQEMQVAGLILENGITSIQNFLKDLYPILVVGYLIEEQFNVSDCIKVVSVPTLFIYLEKDETYPNQHTKQLFETAGSSEKKLVTLKDKSKDLKNKSIKTYQKAISDFLKELKLRVI
ncbi:MAG: hypothetical protein MUC49_10995 [Raineya sp.]|jgi:hypothetical protein|nr:hypothetical protein [Raineya sp.]